MTLVGRAARRGGQRRSRLLVTALALSIAVLAATALPAAHAAPGDLVVALGDSFSAGEGAPPFDPGTDRAGRNTCHRSSQSWPALLAHRHQARFVSFACSGAETLDVLDGDVKHRQLERRTAQVARLAQLSSVDLVTLTIGGNDAGFATILADCILHVSLKSCHRRYAAGGPHDLAERIRGMRKLLGKVYRRVRAAAPGADLLVLGYPRLFPIAPPRPTCAPSAINVEEIDFLNDRTRQFNRLIRSVARSQGAIFVGVQNAFDGHELRCGKDPERMVNRLLEHGRRSFSFHPNAIGHDRLADLATPAWPPR